MDQQPILQSPEALLIVGLILAGVGLLMFLLANLIMKITGTDIDDHVRRTAHYKHLGFFEQLTATFSDLRNIPPMMGMFGLFAFMGGLVAILISAAMYLFK